MTTAILIGFEYNINKLPGVIIDLYHAYKWCQTFCSQIYLCTDIEFVKDESVLQEAINDKIANEDLYAFYDNISPEIIINDLLSTLKNVLTDKINRLVIYYSGHGIDEYIVLPDNSLLLFTDFKNCVLSSISIETEIFWILDCCNPQGLHLPYKLNGNMFTLSLNTKIKCVKQKITLITSAEGHEKSVATRSGSLFSRYLFRLLLILNFSFDYQKEKMIPLYKNRNLKRLMGSLTGSIRKFYTGYSQTVSIYSSYIQDPVLPMWIGSDEPYDVTTDLTMEPLLLIKK